MPANLSGFILNEPTLTRQVDPPSRPYSSQPRSFPASGFSGFQNQIYCGDNASFGTASPAVYFGSPQPLTPIPPENKTHSSASVSKRGPNGWVDFGELARNASPDTTPGWVTAEQSVTEWEHGPWGLGDLVGIESGSETVDQWKQRASGR